jgi:hypothetical protein
MHVDCFLSTQLVQLFYFTQRRKGKCSTAGSLNLFDAANEAEQRRKGYPIFVTTNHNIKLLCCSLMKRLKNQI